MGTLPSGLTDLVDQNRVDSSGPSYTLEEDENPQYQYQYNSQGESPDMPSSEEISIAPGKEKNPDSLISDEDCDALAFFIFFFYRKVW